MPGPEGKISRQHPEQSGPRPRRCFGRLHDRRRQCQVAGDYRHAARPAGNLHVAGSDHADFLAALMPARIESLLAMLERGQDSALLRFSLGSEYLGEDEHALAAPGRALGSAGTWHARAVLRMILRLTKLSSHGQRGSGSTSIVEATIDVPHHPSPHRDCTRPNRNKTLL